MPKKIKCPVCKETIQDDIRDLTEGDIIFCDSCFAEFVIISLEPFKIEQLEEDEEFEDDFEDEDEGEYADEDEDEDFDLGFKKAANDDEDLDFDEDEDRF